MVDSLEKNKCRDVVLLLRFMAFIFFVSAILCSPWLMARLDPTPPLESVTYNELLISRRHLFFIAVGILLFVQLFLSVRQLGWIRSMFSKPIVSKLLMSVFVFIIPIIIIEIMVRPFTVPHMRSKSKTIFIKDDNIGWRLAPGAKEKWGGVDVCINNKGLYGPEISYLRSTNAVRIMYLGDSVTFGYKLSKYSDSFPYKIEKILEDKKRGNIETVNAGVGGYSPWQEYIFLEDEGLKYKPDLVVLGFVLNDVVEKLELQRFGGNSLGYQLNKTYISFSDWLQHNSAFWFVIMKFRAMFQFGSDIHAGAVEQELVSVKELILPTESRKIEDAWVITFNNLQKISKLCREKNIPFALVIFPFTFQFDGDDNLKRPQKKVREFCELNGIMYIDLLPLMENYINNHGGNIDMMFLDDDHLTVHGSEVVAGMISDWMWSEKKLRNVITNSGEL